MVKFLLFFSLLSSLYTFYFSPIYRRSLLGEWEWVNNLFIKYFSFLTWDSLTKLVTSFFILVKILSRVLKYTNAEGKKCQKIEMYNIVMR